ncbi:MAG: hypothetical protein N4A59_13685 [Marinifilum sp.]|jgi:hypothetical protein|nr:hypothetical protein [Marinifilum sp.]
METNAIKETSARTIKLSAPWYTLQRKIAFTIGQSAEIMVSQLDTKNYQVIVTAAYENTAKALASTLQLKHEIGNITVNILVKDINGNSWVPNEKENTTNYLKDYLKAALVNNPLVFSVQEFKSAAAICCTPNVVQFYNDDVSNPYSFTSMLAADAFREVFRNEIEIYTIGREIGNF